MGYYCTVPQCTSLAGKTKNVKFHRFPRNLPLADKWNVILKRGKPFTKYSKVCSLHFTQADYNVTTMGQWKTLSKDAVPSQNLPKLNPDGTVMVIRKSRTVKCKEFKKEDSSSSDKSDKWSHMSMAGGSGMVNGDIHGADLNDVALSYRMQQNAMNLMPQPHHLPNPNSSIPLIKPEKQDAIMQTDPVDSEESDSDQPNNSYNESSGPSFNQSAESYTNNTYRKDSVQYQKQMEMEYDKEQMGYDANDYDKEQQYQKDGGGNCSRSCEMPKDYTKPNDDYMPQTNEEYNKEAEKYALERKSHNGYEKSVIESTFSKSVMENGYQKLNMYGGSLSEKDIHNRNYNNYLNGYPNCVDQLRNQQHNLQILQDQHRAAENQNYFNESHIKIEIDLNGEDEKYMYERTKDQLASNPMYITGRRISQQQLLEHIQHQVKREPEASAGNESTIQPQGSPYYQNGHANAPGGYYDPLSRPGPELLIAKQNALAAHAELWQNTMKRPFFYSDSNHYNSPQILHRYEDLTRILQ